MDLLYIYKHLSWSSGQIQVDSCSDGQGATPEGTWSKAFAKEASSPVVALPITRRAASPTSI